MFIDTHHLATKHLMCKCCDPLERSRRCSAGSAAERRGFTLIEMLVVIGIVAVLTALLLPTLASARHRSRQTVCASNLNQMSVAYQAYEIDYPDGFYSLALGPAGIDGPQKMYDVRPDWTGDWSGLWPGELEPYLKSVGVYVCPGADMRYVNTFHPPHLPEPLLVSYAWNEVVKGRPETLPERMKQRRNLIKGHESDHLLFVDKPFYKFFYTARHLLSAGFANASQLWISEGYCPASQDKRHPSGSNVLFCDGHVEGMDFAAIWKRFNYEGAEKPPNGYVLP